ncbi:peptidylprolyl isomerase [Bacillus mycoides]|uniref:Foldase protein PrsA n=5 Tax=Bacillus cereus group TaxID=86661 RepID=A0A084IZL5_BACMY|nr:MULTISPECIES: peptidylprolyl isomerase PrsA [Bacillus]EEL06299.1 Foldase protein prsA 1 [Bacillus cereus BDRD-ST196]EJQ71502.1 foldase prsA 3 [Bacillus cereus HuA2-4]EJS08492.1 foldase prsA 3 [Bacillus cereus VDM034]EJS13348.1 foldase prsA 3 [Bacillus cereus VDM062]KXY33260.1 peptidylprolyl isomerase [Bacillus cereus]RAN91641.1 peptidylprolyl isomerase [Bacillus sp. SRB_28]
MKKKKLFMGTIIACVALTLSACGSSENVATSKVGNVTEKELSKELRQTYGKSTLSQMMLNKALLDKYKVSDEEAKKQVEAAKEQMGDKFKVALEQVGLKNEDELKERMKPEIALEKAIRATVTDKDVKDNHKPEMKVSHILVKDEKTAKEVKEKINNGEDFTALAKQYSEDTGSKEQGGEIAGFAPGQTVKEFEEAAYKLDAGQVSEPIKTSYGYHIIKVTDKKELKPFDEVKDTIRKDLEQQRLQDATGKWKQQVINDLLKEADIKVTDKEFKDTFKFLDEK